MPLPALPTTDPITDAAPAWNMHIYVVDEWVPCTANELSDTFSTFDPTNDLSFGNANLGIGKRTRSLRLTVPINKTSPIVLTMGTPQAPTYWTNGEETLTGTIIVHAKTNRGGGDGGLNYDFTAQFIGIPIVSGAPTYS